MNQQKQTVYPYIPNSAPETRREMLEKTGAREVEDLYREIPERLRLKRPLDLPQPFLSEYDLKRHVRGILGRNKSCEEYLSFLGAGCYQHHVPAVVDVIVNRGEFLTAYYGNTYSDMGRFQVMFEYVSMLTELVGMDVAGFPLFDGSSSAGTAVRMCARITGRPEVLVPDTMSPFRMQVVECYCRGKEVKSIRKVSSHPDTGLMDLDDLKSKISSQTAAVFFENPSYLGMIETQGREIAEVVHANGSLVAVGVNPMSLGVLAPPGHYGADVVSGDTQPLGVHMSYGGGACGFVAVRDVEAHIAELPPLMDSIADLEQGEGFGFNLFAWAERLSYAARENAKEYTGTSTALWSTANAVYMALMGPQGMREIGAAILQKSHYLRKLLAEVPGIRMPFRSAHFNEFVVSYEGAGRTVRKINQALLKLKIFGGKDLSREFPQLGQSALYCVSEVHTAEALKRLAQALKEVLA
ncbi:MAG: aminomethyl-transferring glycine dehydrogenase subunit GcvPA [bacterium]